VSYPEVGAKVSTLLSLHHGGTTGGIIIAVLLHLNSNSGRIVVIIPLKIPVTTT
jgi:hypothetical protein